MDSSSSISNTFSEQLRVQTRVCAILDIFINQPHYLSKCRLFKDNHSRYCLEYLYNENDKLHETYVSLDISRTWLVYWNIHSLDLLNQLPSIHNNVFEKCSCIDFLKECQHPMGGFSGAPQQIPHLASNYAAVMSLMIISTPRAWNSIDRVSMYNFLISVKKEDGCFSISRDGEFDLRCIYCALSVASILNILTPELTTNCAEYIQKCQTYEGGLGGQPGIEAHGGYTYCGVASMIILNKLSLLNLPKLLRWTVHRQMSEEGGFQGRTNKLVDSCYSFWVGSITELIAPFLQSPPSFWLFDNLKLQTYLLGCCQLSRGFRDKPDKSSDYYHTCYSLSGISLSQSSQQSMQVLGDPQNMLPSIHLIYNIRDIRYEAAKKYYESQGMIKIIKKRQSNEI